jgi:D-Tyr-tRNA(Tyr) deacylase
MRALLQRVSSASVSVEDRIVSRIGKGLLILLGVGQGDGEEQAQYLAEKVANLRIFEDDQGKTHLSVLDVRGEALVVSQFIVLRNLFKSVYDRLIFGSCFAEEHLPGPKARHGPLFSTGVTSRGTRGSLFIFG